MFRPTVRRIWTGPAIQLHRSLALSRSRTPALSPAPLREVSAALWSAERSLDLSSSIVAFILNKLLQSELCAYYFSVKGHFAFRVVFSSTA